MTEVEPYSPDECVSMLIHGHAKRGKTTLGSTAPVPVLVLDADGKGFKYLRRKLASVSWDPMREPAPEPDGTWTHCIVNVKGWDVVQQVYRLLSQGQTQFTSVVIDSITEIQRLCKKNIGKGGGLKDYRQWGEMLENMRNVICAFRDLPDVHPTVRCIIMTSESKLVGKRLVPSMQGALQDQLPYMVDVLGYIDMMKVPDEHGRMTETQRYLGIGEDPEYLSGERVQGLLPDIIVNPNVTDMMNKMFKEN